MRRFQRFQKSELRKSIPNFTYKHVITTTNSSSYSPVFKKFFVVSLYYLSLDLSFMVCNKVNILSALYHIKRAELLFINLNDSFIVCSIYKLVIKTNIFQNGIDIIFQFSPESKIKKGFNLLLFEKFQ